MEREPDSPDGVGDHDPALDGPDIAAGGRAALDEPDLDQVERDLADVETALDRLEDGSYWTDELTGDALPDDLLDEHPAARRRDP